MTGLADFVQSAKERHWRVVPMWTLFRRVKRTGFAEEELLSVYRDHGVIPTSSRDDNHNKPSLDLSGYQLVEPGDLATNKMKTWQGSIAISRYRGIVSPAYFIYRPTQQQHDQYLHYLLRSQPYVAEYGRISKGVRVNQWDLDEAAFRALPVPFPDLPTQKAIAAFLDRETARIDQLIEKKQRLVELLGERFQASVYECCTKGLDRDADLVDSGIDWIGAVPSHWTVEPLRCFFKFRNEKNDPQKTSDILSLSIAHGVTPYSEEGRGGNKRKDDLTAYKLAYPGDIVLNSMNVIVGAIGRSNYFGAISPVYYAMVARKGNFDAVYFDHLFQSRGFQKGLLRFGKGIMMKQSGTGKLNTIRMKISQADLKNLPLPNPPLAEQNKIAAVLSEESRRTKLLRQRIDASIDRLKEYRSALITAAVTGQIDVETWSRRGEGDRRLDRIEEEMAG